MQRREPNLRLLIALLVIMLAGLFYAFMHARSLSAMLTVNAVPAESQVLINGKRAQNGDNRVKPGAQKVTVKLDGFTSISQTVTVKKGQEKSLNIILSSNSTSTSDWYLTHPKDAKAAEAISDKETDQLSDQAQAENSIITLLPFVGGGLEFRVDYGNVPGEQASKPVIYITAPTPQGQQDGLAWIISIGYDPAKYTINYVTGQVQPLGS
jgi:hypothetical protein